MTTTHLLAPAVQKAMEAPGLMLAQLNGSAAGQTVPHFHMHIIPRHKGLEMLGHGTEMAIWMNWPTLPRASAPQFSRPLR